VNRVEVFLGAIRVGEIERFDDQFGPHVFRFDRDYLKLARRPVLGQLFEDRLPRDIETDGLTPWFEHLLPPSGSPLRRAIARAAMLDDEDGLGLLAWLGDELPGAVRVQPPPNAAPYRRSESRQLSLPTGPFRMSLAGNQWKLSLRRAEDDNFVLPLQGAGEWIAKFHGSDFPQLARVEHATMTWAARAGLPVPRHQLVSCDDIAELPVEVPRGDGFAFVIERFDWRPTGRVHVEDFGQIFDRPPGQTQYAESYESIGIFLAIEAPTDVDSFIERVVFMVLSGNSDAHLKNWAVTYPDQTSLRLAPCYDLVSTVVYPRLQKRLALKLNGQSDLRFEDVTGEALVTLAVRLGRAEAAARVAVTAMATRVRDALKDVESLFSAAELAAVRKNLEAVAL
jgi:serine/threonine-protein kinase HipA